MNSVCYYLGFVIRLVNNNININIYICIYYYISVEMRSVAAPIFTFLLILLADVVITVSSSELRVLRNI